MEQYFITFRNNFLNGYKKYAVSCKDMNEAREVAYDADSLEGINNVRLRRCGKPRKDFKIMNPDEYFDYSSWISAE